MSYPTGMNPDTVGTADFNNDGRLDLVTSNTGVNTVSVLLGNADGTFQPAQTSATGAYPQAVTVGDFDGDGRIDLATAINDTGDDFSILLGNGDGTFAPAVRHRIDFNLWSRSIVTGDLDADGRLDLVVTSDDPGSFAWDAYVSVRVLLGQGDGTFTLAATSFFGYDDSVVLSPPVLADFDRDGNADVALVVDGWVKVLLGDGDGTLQPARTAASGANLPSMAVGDFTGDGILDLVANTMGSGWVNVLPGRGDGTFKVPIPSFSYLGESIAVADFNGDGKLDAVTGYWSGENLSLLLGRGDGTFALPDEPWAGWSITAVAIGDFNGDTRGDVATADYTLSAVSVLLNDGDWATKTYVGPASGGNWSTAANWSPGGVPAAGDHVSIAGKSVNLAGGANVASLSLSGGATLTVGGNGNRVVRTGALSISDTSTLNLNDNDLIIDYSGASGVGASPIGAWNGASYTGVTGMIARAFTYGDWSGGGLVTTTGQARSGVTTLAVAETARLFDLTGTQTAMFSGQTVDATAVLVKYTYTGDINLDGSIDGADYGVIDNWVQFPGTNRYENGDFNFDGIIDGADYGLIDNAIQFQGLPL